MAGYREVNLPPVRNVMNFVKIVGRVREGYPQKSSNLLTKHEFQIYFKCLVYIKERKGKGGEIYEVVQELHEIYLITSTFQAERF